MPDETMVAPRKAFFYLRHGQTDWNIDGRCQGQTDIPMNATGDAQVAASVLRLPTGEISRIVSSPLIRARQSAAHAATRLGLPVTYDDGLMEAYWGDAEGKADGSWQAEWRLGADVHRAELFAVFRKRIVDAVSRTLALPGTPLIVGHGGGYWPIELGLGREGFSHLPNGTLLHHQPMADPSGTWKVTFV